MQEQSLQDGETEQSGFASGTPERADSIAPALTASTAAASTASTAPTPTRPKLWTPVFVTIVMLTLCTFIVGQGTNSGTSVYLSLKGGSSTYAGILAAVFSVAAAVVRLLCGPIIDRRGRRLIMVAGAAVMFVGTIGPAFSQNTALFVLWRFLQGAGFAAAGTASATAAADVLPMERLGEGIGYYGLGQAISMSIGPALALFLVTTNPAENLYLGLSAAAALTVLFAVLCRYEKNPQTLPETSAYRRHWEKEEAMRGGSPGSEEATATARVETCADSTAPSESETAPPQGAAAPKPQVTGIYCIFEPRALPGTLPMLILSPAFGFGIFFVGLYGTSLGVGSAGLFFTAAAVSMIAVRLKSGAFMDRVLPIKIFTVSTLCGLVAYLMLFAAGMSLPQQAAEALFYASGIPYGVCLGISLPLNQAVAVKNTPSERWGATNALFLLASDVGIGVASVIWGMVNDSFGFTATICCVLGCIIASYALAWAVYPESAKRTQA